MKKNDRKRTTKFIFVSILIVTLTFGIVYTVQAIFINRNLSGPTEIGRHVSSFKLSPDGKYTVFRANFREPGITELFSVPTTGGERVQLNTPLLSSLNVSSVLISPNSQTVVYLVNGPDRSIGLYAVPIAGGSVTTLVDGLTADRWIEDITFSYDSEHIVFIKVKPWEDELFTVPITGSDPIQISSSYENYIDIKYVALPNALGVVYLPELELSPMQLIHSDLLGSNEIYDTDLIFNDVALTPDGDYIIYTKKTDTTPAHPDELFSLPIEGGTPVRLNQPLVEDGNVINFKISPNSKYVIYKADELFDGREELFAVKADGTGIRVPLIQSMPADGDVLAYKITPNSQGVVYLADQLADQRFDLGSVAMTGGTNYWLNKTMVAGGDVSSFAITPNSLGVVFIADKDVDEKDELYAVSVFGSNLTKLNTEFPSGRIVSEFKISPNSQGVVYKADQDSIYRNELYLAAIVGGGDVYKLNGQLVPGGDVAEFLITPDSRGVVYLADQDEFTTWELFITYDYQPVYLPLIIK